MLEFLKAIIFVINNDFVKCFHAFQLMRIHVQLSQDVRFVGKSRFYSSNAHKITQTINCKSLNTFVRACSDVSLEQLHYYLLPASSRRCNENLEILHVSLLVAASERGFEKHKLNL